MKTVAVPKPKHILSDSLQDFIRNTGRGNQSCLLPVKFDRRLTDNINYNATLVQSDTLLSAQLVEDANSWLSDHDLTTFAWKHLVFVTKAELPNSPYVKNHEYPGYVEWANGQWLDPRPVVVAVLTCVGLLDNTRTFTTRYTEREVRKYLDAHLQVLCVKLRHYLNSVNSYLGTVNLSKKPIKVNGELIAYVAEQELA